MGAAGSAVQELPARVEREQPIVAPAVMGLSLRQYKAIGLSPQAGVNPTTLIHACAGAGSTLPLVDLGSGNESIVRGVCTGGAPLRTAEAADGGESDSVDDSAHRLVQVTWTLVDGDGNRAWALDDATGKWAPTRTHTLHYIAKYGTTKRWFLFEEDVVLRIPEHLRVCLTVVFGPWAGHGRRYFEVAGNRADAFKLAAKVSQVLPLQGLQHQLLPASALTPEGTPPAGGVYLALAGLGVGKTSGRVTDCIRNVCRQKGRSAYYS